MNPDGLALDTLKESFNIAVGQAANALGILVDEEVLFSVPDVQLYPRGELLLTLPARLGSDPQVIIQELSGLVDGDAIDSFSLLLVGSGALESLRRIFSGGAYGDTGGLAEEEMLVEVGNVLLNACMGSIANLLGTEFLCGIPRIGAGPLAETLQSLFATTSGGHPAPRDRLLLLTIRMSAVQSCVTVELMLLLDLLQLPDMKKTVAGLLERAMR
ncbi:MAG: hypothetical protein H7831_11355 [Magnetococcus sp. WYHC-3]